MPKWGMVIDLDKCTACQACVVACKQENNVPSGHLDDAAKARGEVHRDHDIFWMRVLTQAKGEYPKPEIEFLPRPCQHCEKPPCVSVCPVEATYRNEEGLVLQRYDRCIGCRYCMVACPYGVRNFNWHEPEYPMPQALSPAASVDSDGNGRGPQPRVRGIVEKCTFCIQRIEEAKRKAQAEGRPLKDGDVQTACMQTCPPTAIVFGDLDDPNSRVSKLRTDRRAFRLLEDLGTNPRVTYLSEG
ncbi:MAG: 4Fe-4S dicluster domain-containing protein [Euryarchaeota archaeon]|nr:4Fe-4S dicluster domain-containing protein [Euryarchaeota archaeon]